MPAISYARITILGALVTVLLAAFFPATRGLNLAVDLTGGTIIEVHYPEAVASNSVQNALVMAGVTDTKVSGLSAYRSICSSSLGQRTTSHQHSSHGRCLLSCGQANLPWK